MTWVLLATASLLVSPIFAQDDNAPVPTIRVYTNVLQIPTLVLDSNRRPIPRIAESRFLVSIDEGRKSRVSHVRLEGDDPIAMAILIDAKILSSKLRPRLKNAIAGLMPDSLHAQDSVSLHVLECGLSRVSVGTPLTAARLSEASDLVSDAMDRAAALKPCSHEWNLLDSMVSAIDALQGQRGRRVLLVLSDGEDRGSRNNWDAVRQYAELKGVAVFAVANIQDAAQRPGRTAFNVQAAVPSLNLLPLCAATGGMLIDDVDDGFKSELRDFVHLVRSRYIVEFPRPATGAGWHSMEISVAKLSAIVRPAGVSVPLPDPALAKDRNTILPDPSQAPEVGSRPPKQ